MASEEKPKTALEVIAEFRDKYTVHNCNECQLWKNGECLVRGIRRVATAPSCEYGRAKMGSAYQVKWFRNKRRAAKES